VDIPELVTGLLMSDIAAGAEQGTGQLDEREEPTPPAVIVSLSASMSESSGRLLGLPPTMMTAWTATPTMSWSGFMNR
jgi:hypothetical protein